MRTREQIQKDIDNMIELESSVTNELLLDIRDLIMRLEATNGKTLIEAFNSDKEKQEGS